MWSKLLEYLRHLLLHKEQTEKNTSDLKQVKQDVEELTSILQRFGLELAHLQVTEAHERENLALRLENALLRYQRSLPSSDPKIGEEWTELRTQLEVLKRENEQMRRRIEELEQK
jgi:predicted RNase H-like nuclease (RuvC/YqgF family)